MRAAVVRGILIAGLAGVLAMPGVAARQQHRPADATSGAAPQSPGPRKDAPSPSDQPSTGLSDQVDLSLAVYNSDLALVRDVRQLTLPSGSFTLRFVDVAASVNPATVHLRSLSEPSALSVLEQNYEYDLLEPDRLLRKYVGREMTLVRDRQENASTRTEEVKALLLAYNDGGPVWKIGNDIVTGMRVDQFRFPELPENLFSHPTLVWMLENGGAARHRVEASYLAGRLSWSADYVLTVGRDDRTADITGWVTLKNESGTSYKNARLQLVAGEVHRTPVEEAADRMKVQRVMAAAAAGSAFEREAFSEYHLYTLQRRTSVNDRESKQITLLTSPSVPVEKRFVVDGQEFYYRNPQSPGAPLKDAVKLYYRFRNDEKAGMGVPMPAGIVRVYQADAKGGVLFAGEDRISHTPKDETIDLYTGNAFDIACERRQTDYRKLSGSLFEMEYEITLRNHKDTPVTVEVNEPIGGDWQMLEASHKWTKTGAWAARFEVPVAKDGTSVLKYRVRARW